jgi:hypothetical protein
MKKTDSSRPVARLTTKATSGEKSEFVSVPGSGKAAAQNQA